jgi:FKBP-type peptidyl-prolyl cis-trans isomerase
MTGSPIKLIALAALIASCGDASDDAPADTTADSAMEVQPGGQVATAYAAELGVDLNAMAELEGGLRIRDFEPGAGDTASAGDRVSVDYTGWLPNGVQFDASEGDPITFTLGVGEVITGWDTGIAGMQAGGRRMLVIPPGMAYGDRGRAGVIPPNATLVFDVTLVEVRPDTAAAAGPGGP